jgi:hypothetical protein
LLQGRAAQPQPAVAARLWVPVPEVELWLAAAWVAQ